MKYEIFEFFKIFSFCMKGMSRSCKVNFSRKPFFSSEKSCFNTNFIIFLCIFFYVAIEFSSYSFFDFASEKFFFICKIVCMDDDFCSHRQKSYE